MGITRVHTNITRLHRSITRLHRGITIIHTSAARRRRRRIVDPVHAAFIKGLDDTGCYIDPCFSDVLSFFELGFCTQVPS